MKLQKRRPGCFISYLLVLAMVFSLMPPVSMRVYAEGESLLGTVAKVGDTVDFNDAYVQDAEASMQYAQITVSEVSYVPDEAAWHIVFTIPDTEDAGYLVLAGDESPVADGFEITGGDGSAELPYVLALHYPEAGGHEHNYSEEWTYDDTFHWHVCEADDATEECLNDEGGRGSRDY